MTLSSAATAQLWAAVFRFAVVAALVLPFFGLRADDSAYAKYVEAFRAGSAALRSGDLETGLPVVEGVIEEIGEGALEEVGPVFGQLHYLKGIFHIRLGQVDEAIVALRHCIDSYRNDPKALEKNPRRNGYIGAARAQLGAAYMARGDHAAAIPMLEIALEESRTRSGTAALNLARCYLKQGDPRGGRMLRVILEGVDTADVARFEAMLILVEDWAFGLDDDKLLPFLAEQRPNFARIPKALRLRGNARLLRLARRSMADNNPARAQVWFSLIQNPEPVFSIYRHRIEQLRSRPDPKGEIGSYINRLEQEMTEQEALVDAVLVDRAAACLAASDHHSAGTIYQFLVEHRKELEARPVLLHNLLVCHIQRAEWSEAAEVAAVFFDEFSAHQLLPEVARMYSDALYAKEDFDECLRVAGERRGAFPAGSAQRHPLDFNFAMSLYRLGRFEDAEKELDSFVEAYAEGSRTSEAIFFQGATKVDLRNWDLGVEILDDFCGRYPDSPYRSTALYLAALCYLQSDLLDEALARATEVTEKYPESSVLAVAQNIRGDVLLGIGEAPVEEVMDCFEKGKAAAEDNEDAPAAAYALWQLIGLASYEGRWEDVGRFFDEFLFHYPQSPFHVELLVASLPGLGHLDRAHQAINLLEKAILGRGSSAVSPELSELFGTYAAYLREQIPSLEVLERLKNFPGPDPLPLPIQGWVEMAKVETKKLMNPQRPQKEINSHFYRMKIEIERGNLANYCLLRLARWEAEVRRKPEDARQHYQYLIDERKGLPGYEFALFDIARLDGQSEDAGVRQQALEAMLQLLKDHEAPDLVEPATVEIGRIHASLGQWSEARRWWESYLRNRAWSAHRAEANFNVARCAEEGGDQNEALKLFVSVYVNFPGQLKWSTEAYIRSARILKSQKKDEKALLVLRDMIVRMRKMEHPAVAEALDLFLKWRAEYEAKLKARKNA